MNEKYDTGREVQEMHIRRDWSDENQEELPPHEDSLSPVNQTQQQSPPQERAAKKKKKPKQ